MRAVLLLTLALSLAGQQSPQPVPHRWPFRVELRQEDWYQDGKRDERTVRVTRLPDQSVLIIQPYSGPREPKWRIGHEFFFLVDRAARISYQGDTLTRAATPHYLNDQSNIGDPYGECSVLKDATIRTVAAGEILSHPVFRFETTEANERTIKWIAPEVDCFPLRSQVLVDEVVREKVEAISVTRLLDDTKLALPRGIRVLPPKDYCDLYRKRHRGEEVLPARVCSRLQQEYEEHNAALRK